MICEALVKRYCKDPASMIENYHEAMMDKSQTWICHHKDEVKVLPSGITVVRSPKELMENNRYYNCPANELIFLTRKEHNILHNKVRVHSKDTRQKISEAHKGKHHSAETRLKMTKAWERRRTHKELTSNY